jgi:glycosyltransferase involved in cell wall biosynthesis
MSREGLSKIALIGNYLPRKCGIATFTYDLSRALTHEGSGPECFVVAVNDRPEGYAYSPDVRFEIAEQDLPSYRLAADFLQSANVDVLCVQHEFGIYGGTAGSHLLALLRRLDLPIVTHLHTILEEPSLEQMDVMQELICLSTRLIVMNKRGRRILKETYNTPSERIDLIPHGIPDMPFVDPDLHKKRFGLEGKRVLFTFGLISPGKGLEYVIRALPEVLEVFPDLIYIVLGATHPTLLREQGETYRMNLERLAEELGVAKNVIFLNRFVPSSRAKSLWSILMRRTFTLLRISTLARLRPEPLRTLSAAERPSLRRLTGTLRNSSQMAVAFWCLFKTAKLSPASLSRYSKTTNVETRCAKGPICLGVPWFGTKWNNVF